MNAVLLKTMQSLEAALRYNPRSIDLMASLAEVCVRLGRFDRRSMELCETVLAEQPGNVLLRQAQAVGAVIERSRAIEESLKTGASSPDREELAKSIGMLDAFLAQSPECVDGWIAWTRHQLLAGDVEQAWRGVRLLAEMEVPDLLPTFHQCLERAAANPEMTADQAALLSRIYHLLGAQPQVLTLFEKLYDGGRLEIGQVLLNAYLERFDPSRPQEVPDAIRNRFFRLLLDHADRELTGRWLRQAAVAGWQVSDYSKDYAHSLFEEDRLTEAFAMLQQSSLDAQTRELLNRIAQRHEERDEVGEAVAVLRYLNDHALADPLADHRRETELARDAELSMAERCLRGGRYIEALAKYVNVLCMNMVLDIDLLDQIDDLIATFSKPPVEPLLRLGIFFRQLGDQPKAMSYFSQALLGDPRNPEVFREMESFYLDILAGNPDLPKLRLELGKLYREQGRLEEAIDQLVLAGAAPHLSAEVNPLLAQAYLAAGKHPEALEKYRVSQIQEDAFPDLYRLHEEFLSQGAPREALAALDLIARVNPSWNDVQEKMALLEDQVGKLAPEAVADPKMRELIGDLAIGRYQYLDRLGAGGMGVVYKVFDIRNRITVAMKILRDNLSSSTKALDRFFREARIAATLNHRNIVKIHDYNISNLSGQSYIVMEYVDGQSLRDIIDHQFQSGDLIDMDYVAETLYYGIQLADALDATHKKGIIHRDIKPDNIMITGLGEVKITDFGIVHIEEATFTPSGAMLGTPRYMAPEQVTGVNVDGRSDIYSMGILLYESLVGSPPFMSGDISYQQVHKAPVPPREIGTTIPQSVNDIILRCLAKNPEERYPDARSLMGELAQALEDLGGCAKYGMQNATQVIDGPMPGQPQSVAASSGGNLAELDLDLE
jgi:tetratricopeptide (TPR) repeat protein